MIAQEVVAPIWAAVSKPSPTRDHTTNWSDCNAVLRRRGSLLVWLDREMEWLAPKHGRPGRPQTFSDAAIQFSLSTKVLFGLALRQIEPRGATGSSPLARGDGGKLAEDGGPRLAGAGLL